MYQDMHACPERSLAARCGRSSLPVMERIACLNTWLRESIECASWRGSTLLLSGRPLSSNTSAARWHTFVKHRKVALIGSSTMRAMVADQNLDKPLSSFLHAEQSTVPADGGTVWLPNNTWKVTAHGCNEITASGCLDCKYACCGQANCPGRGADFTWRDFTLQDGAGQGTGGAGELHFSWKPEYFSHADETAFATRFCVDPPHVLYIDKGLHDACFVHGGKGVDVLVKIAEDELRRFAQLLRCLPGPPRTLVVIRAPLYAGAGPPCRSPTPELLSATRDAVRRLHAEGVFGPALLLDGYSLGHSLLTNATREPPPSDWASPYGGGRDIVNRKHGWPPWHAAHVPPYRYNTAHYTAAFQDAQWQLLLLVMRALHGACLKQSTDGEA